MSEEVAVVPAPAVSFSLAQLMPRDIKQLAWFAGEAARSGLFTVREGQHTRNLTQPEAFLMMSQGVELGLTPLQSLRELNIINGRVDVPASVRAAKIASDPRTTTWDVESSNERCTITAKRRDRDNACTVTVIRDEQPQADLRRHQDHMEDWLYARAVRKISRKYFPDMNLGIGTEEFREVVDVRAVERITGNTEGTYGFHVGEKIEGTDRSKWCGGTWYLQGAATGGAYLRCDKCGKTQPPPQEVRDTIRGRITPPDDEEQWVGHGSTSEPEDPAE